MYCCNFYPQPPKGGFNKAPLLGVEWGSRSYTGSYVMTRKLENIIMKGYHAKKQLQGSWPQYLIDPNRSKLTKVLNCLYASIQMNYANDYKAGSSYSTDKNVIL